MAVILGQVLTTIQKPQQEKNHQQCCQEKDDAAVTVQVSVEKSRVDAGSEHSDDENSKPILGNRKWNRGYNHRGLSAKMTAETNGPAPCW